MALAARKNKQMKNQEKNHTYTQFFIDIHNTNGQPRRSLLLSIKHSDEKKDMGVNSLAKLITPLFPE